MNSETPPVGPRRVTHEQFIRLFLQCERDLMRYVMVLVPNLTDASDVLQEAAVALWRKIDEYDPDKPFVHWACRFVLNEARTFLRDQFRRNRLESEVVALLHTQRIEDAERLDERRRYLRECLRELPALQAEMVKSHYLFGESISDLCQRLGRSLEATYKSLQRARRSLHVCIDRKIAQEAKR